MFLLALYGYKNVIYNPKLFLYKVKLQL